MRVLVAGNPLVESDSIALRVAEKLGKKWKQRIEFERIASLPETLPKKLVLLDTAKGISRVEKITDLKRLETLRLVSLHDLDIATELLLYKKIGLVEKTVIIAIPVNYALEKAVAEVQQILGSCR